MGDEEDREPLMPSQELVKNNLASFLELDGKKSVLFFVFIVLYCSNFWGNNAHFAQPTALQEQSCTFLGTGKKKILLFLSQHDISHCSGGKHASNA